MLRSMRGMAMLDNDRPAVDEFQIVVAEQSLL